MNWQQDLLTAQAAANHPLQIEALVPAPQFAGRNFNPANWNHRTLARENWPIVQPLLSSPENIIFLFQQNSFLEALAMVVSWGTMWRQSQRIYGNRNLADIRNTLQHSANSIQQTHSIQTAWTMLTGNEVGQLGWSAVLTSKTLHFLTRALGLVQQPPVALDNVIIRKRVWPAFIEPILQPQRPLNWEGNTFAAYSRYMTAILVWANQRGWTTTETEATIFQEYH